MGSKNPNIKMFFAPLPMLNLTLESPTHSTTPSSARRMGNGGLHSIPHNNSALPLLPPHTFPLLWRGLLHRLHSCQENLLQHRLSTGGSSFRSIHLFWCVPLCRLQERSALPWRTSSSFF